MNSLPTTLPPPLKVGYLYQPKLEFDDKVPNEPFSMENLAVATQQAQYEFVATNVLSSNDYAITRQRLLENEAFGFLLDDLQFRSEDYSGFAQGVLDWIQFERTFESETEFLIFEKLIIKSIEWCIHIGLPTVYLPPLKTNFQEIHLITYSRSINMIMMKFEGRIQLILPIELDHFKGSLEAWKRFHRLRNLCSSSLNINLSLILDKRVSKESSLNLEQFYGENVISLIIPAQRFLFNKKGYPVLAKKDQIEIKDAYNLWHTILVQHDSYKDPHPSHSCDGQPSIAAYQDYLRHITKSKEPSSFDAFGLEFSEFANGYQDFLQAPLQPLKDHLESATYEVFEKDPIKYQLYEDAIYHALLDRKSAYDPIVVLVAGAGRGPLVDRSLKASARANVTITLLALEKNPNAFVTLQNRKVLEWGDSVNLYFGDMRTLVLPSKVDILVSELLGSFGDNELSPECLDGAMKFLKDTGISIPASYTSFVNPMTSAKLHRSLINHNDPISFEIPYVVMFKQVRHLAEPQPTWSFHHPSSTDPNAITIDHSQHAKLQSRYHNIRSCHLRFQSSKAGLVHGLGGYFECILYKHIQMNIHPHSHSPNMFSWFPLFFPVRHPICVNKGEVLEVAMWRRTESSRVWYEWVVTNATTGVSSGLLNTGGHAYSIGL